MTNKILIIDDSESNLDYIKSLLLDQTYKVAMASGGKAALLKIRSQKFDLVLLDYVMPGMNGLEVCREIRNDKLNADTPVIFLTADQSEHTLAQAFEAGAVDFIKKPFSGTELIARVKNHLNLVEHKKQLATARDYAESASSAKGEFLANMSHEIRTPMNGIVTVVEFLKDTPLTQKQTELLDIIKSSSDSLLQIINDILDFSKIEAGQIELEKLHFNLKDELDLVLKPLDLRAHAKGLFLRLDYDTQIPLSICGDALRIKQIIINLVNNAIKFTNTGGVTIHVKMAQSTEDQLELLFNIEDTGIGILPQNQGKLFKSFSQTDASSTRKYGGTGLGLAISKSLVEMMNGKIWLKSDINQGATFSFNLILSKTMCNHETEIVVPTIEKKALEQKTILVVDDNAINRKVAEMTLMKLGHKVEMASTGIEAYQKYISSSFDFILMDVHMPDLDGLEATALIRKYEEEHQIANPIPVIAMTAAAMKGDRERFMEAGMTEYISKPFKVKDIEIMLQLFFDK